MDSGTEMEMDYVTYAIVLAIYCCSIVFKQFHTDKKENQIFLIYKEIQNGAVAKSYMTNGLLIYGEIFAHFLINEEALHHI